MAVASAVAAVGLAALVAAPGAPGQTGEIPGTGSLHITLESTTSNEEGLRPGDRIEYTIRVRNSGEEELPEAQVVQYLPPTVRHVSGSGDAAVEERKITWTRSLAPGERASLRMTGEVTGFPEGARRPVTTACLRPAPGAVLAACSAESHRVQAVLPFGWALAGVLGFVAAAFGIAVLGRLLKRRNEAPRSEEPREHAPGEVPDLRTFPGRSNVLHMDVNR